ncbi:MAG: hypothetical protein JW904_13275 [Spirochaetales bacterium]|nr:hypothetical protein [Spirochaetales bacterium]
MNKNIILLTLVLLLFSAAAVFAQEKKKEEAEDPGDLFPSMVLEIDDLSKEQIDAGFTPDEDLMTFEQEAPLPQPDEIPIDEPDVDLIVPGQDGEYARIKDKSFFTKVLFGVGLQSNLLSEITFFKLKEQPIVKLFYKHENADGFAYNQIGLGYHARQDEFEGSIKIQMPGITIEADGGFHEKEQGLQEQVAYFSTINQFSHLDALFAFKLADFFTLSTITNFQSTSLHLTGDTNPVYTVAYPPIEFAIREQLIGDARWESVTIQLALNYKYRNIAGDADYETHRFRTDLSLGFELGDWFLADAAAGFFTSSDIPYLVPFTITLHAYPADWLKLSAGGGYKIEERDLFHLLSGFDYADFPASLADNHGWFANASVQISLENSLLIIADATISENRSYVTQGETMSGTTGLFPVIYTPDVWLFHTDVKLRFPVFNWLALSSVNAIDIPFDTELHSSFSVGGELAAEHVEGLFGAAVTLRIKAEVGGIYEFPYLDASAFVRVLDNMKFILEGLDLLSPLLGRQRESVYPYLSPGIRARFKFQITF